MGTNKSKAEVNRAARMAAKTIALISGQSLLVEGVASRLRAHPKELAPEILNPDQNRLLETLEALEPEVIILDINDPAVRASCPLHELLQRQSDATILVLDSERSGIQVVRSQRLPTSDLDQLLEQILALV